MLIVIQRSATRVPGCLPGWLRARAAEWDAASTNGLGFKQLVDSTLHPSESAFEQNFLLNPAHPEFAQITTSLHQPVWWDSRLFVP